MEEFTPISAALGGGLIGLSAVMMMGLHGRIAGISGLCAGAVFGAEDGRAWRALFLVGLLLGPVLVWLASGERPAFVLKTPGPVILAGGLLVGFGTQMGSGCTSGHGVCGIARLSPRSLVSTLTFMALGVLTVALIRPLFGG